MTDELGIAAGGQRRSVLTDAAPAPAGAYVHAVVAGGFVFVSGQGPKHPHTGVVSGEFGEQVRQTLRNVEAILLAAGSSLAAVVKVNAYLSDATRFEAFNAIYREVFAAPPPPARTTIACQLIGIQVEIDCIATLVPQPTP